jgi:hypothetical protein
MSASSAIQRSIDGPLLFCFRHRDPPRRPAIRSRTPSPAATRRRCDDFTAASFHDYLTIGVTTTFRNQTFS